MSTTILVGVPLRPQPAISGKPARQVINDVYLAAIARAGAVPVPLPLVADGDTLRPLYERLDALCLPGGADVDPRLYGEEARADLRTMTDLALDEHELRLLRWALEDDLPVLAICRGLQLLNVALGGSLWQDLELQDAAEPGHDGHGADRGALMHDLDVQDGTLLAGAIGAGRLRVNSLHHQGVRDVAPPLVVVGRSQDGLVEALEHPGRHFVLGVQCHPEELSGRAGWADAIFAALVDAAARARSGPGPRDHPGGGLP